MNGEKTGQPNSLKKLYQAQRMSVRSAIREELTDRGANYQRLAYWLNRASDSEMIGMPYILKEIVCRNIPAAEKLFVLPEINKPESTL